MRCYNNHGRNYRDSTGTQVEYTNNKREHVEKRQYEIKFKEERQCTYYVTLWRIRVTTFAVEKQQFIILLNYM